MFLLPYISSAIIIVAFLYAYKYIKSVKISDIKLHRNWMEQLPSLISTLGVIGTFVGITIGLLAFDPNNLDKSIPELLEGLKTAFFTSLFGMVGSIILNRELSNKLAENKDVFDLKKATDIIVEALNNNNLEMRRHIPSSDIKEMRKDLEQIKDDVEEMKAKLTDFQRDSKSNNIPGILNNIEAHSSAMNTDMDRTRAILATATASISALDNNVDELKDIIKKNSINKN